MTKRHFSQGNSTFICTCCGHRTRIVDQPEGSDLCPDCYDLFGLQNMVWDGCADARTVSERDRLLKALADKGADVDKAKRQLKDLLAYKA